MENNFLKFNKKRNGFTLVEIMVATSIFMMVMLIALGSLLTSSNTSKKAQALRTSMDNVSFALESMTRTLRMGTNYMCVDSVLLPDSTDSSLGTTDCPITSSGKEGVTLTPYDAPLASLYGPNARTIGYLRVTRANGTHTIQRCDISNTPTCLEMVSQEIDITYLKFFIKGSNKNDNLQPSIYIVVKGTVTIKGQPTNFAVQTMVSQRSFE